MRLSQKLLPVAAAIESVIQDVQIPFENAPSFCDFLLAEIGITPVWVCPFKTSRQTYDLCGLKPNQPFINFGFWGTVPMALENGHYNKMIEDKVAKLEGRNGLYSTSYYDKDTFWSMYDQKRYEKLKNAYDPDKLFSDLYAKCVERK